jgi:hypothetical protein
LHEGFVYILGEGEIGLATGAEYSGAVFLLPPYIPPYYEVNGNISIPNSTSLGYNPTNPDLDALGVGYISI